MQKRPAAGKCVLCSGERHLRAKKRYHPWGLPHPNRCTCPRDRCSVASRILPGTGLSVLLIGHVPGQLAGQAKRFHSPDIRLVQGHPSIEIYGCGALDLASCVPGVPSIRQFGIFQSPRLSRWDKKISAVFCFQIGITRIKRSELLATGQCPQRSSIVEPRGRCCQAREAEMLDECTALGPTK